MSGPPKTKIFVGRLPETCKSDDLRTLFEKYGTVTECDVLNRYGFVHMSTPEEAEEAIRQLNDHDFQGSRISVEPSTGKRSGRGGGGGGSGGGGGGGGSGRSGGPMRREGGSNGRNPPVVRSGGSSRAGPYDRYRADARPLPPPPLPAAASRAAYATDYEDYYARSRGYDYEDYYARAAVSRDYYDRYRAAVDVYGRAVPASAVPHVDERRSSSSRDYYAAYYSRSPPSSSRAYGGSASAYPYGAYPGYPSSSSGARNGVRSPSPPPRR